MKIKNRLRIIKLCVRLSINLQNDHIKRTFMPNKIVITCGMTRATDRNGNQYWADGCQKIGAGVSSVSNSLGQQRFNRNLCAQMHARNEAAKQRSNANRQEMVNMQQKVAGNFKKMQQQTAQNIASHQAQKDKFNAQMNKTMASAAMAAQQTGAAKAAQAQGELAERQAREREDANKPFHQKYGHEKRFSTHFEKNFKLDNPYRKKLETDMQQLKLSITSSSNRNSELKIELSKIKDLLVNARSEVTEADKNVKELYRIEIEQCKKSSSGYFAWSESHGINDFEERIAFRDSIGRNQSWEDLRPKLIDNEMARRRLSAAKDKVKFLETQIQELSKRLNFLQTQESKKIANALSTARSVNIENSQQCPATVISKKNEPSTSPRAIPAPASPSMADVNAQRGNALSGTTAAIRPITAAPAAVGAEGGLALALKLARLPLPASVLAYCAKVGEGSDKVPGRDLQEFAAANQTKSSIAAPTLSASVPTGSTTNDTQPGTGASARSAAAAGYGREAVLKGGNGFALSGDICEGTRAQCAVRDVTRRPERTTVPTSPLNWQHAANAAKQGLTALKNSTEVSPVGAKIATVVTAPYPIIAGEASSLPGSEYYRQTLPTDALDLPVAKLFETASNHRATVESNIRGRLRLEGQRFHIELIKTAGKTPIRVFQGESAGEGVYRCSIPSFEGLPGRTIYVTPEKAPGAGGIGVLVTPNEAPKPVANTGNQSQPVTLPTVLPFPAGEEFDFNDLIVVPPSNSGYEPVYVMLSGRKESYEPNKGAVGNMGEFFRQPGFGEIAKSNSQKTSKVFQGQPVHKATADINQYIHKGDQFYLDGYHKNHLEVFDRQNRFLNVLNLDGSFNPEKTERAAAEGRRLPK